MYGPEFADDLAGFYRKVRAERGPVAPVLLVGDVPAWLVLSYREVVHVCRNPQIFARSSYNWNLWPEIPEDWPLMYPLIPIPSMVNVPRDEHARRAGAMSDVLEAVDRLELVRMCERTADELIDAFSGAGEADLVAQYAQELVLMVLARLLGYPEERISDLNRILIQVSTSGPDAAAAGMRLVEVMGEFVAGLRKDAAEQKEPGDGLAARLVRHPAALTDEELILDLALFFGAGHQPTANWIGSTLRLMLIDDEFSLNLQGGRYSVDQALNEVLWREPPAHAMVGRWAVRNIDLGGHRIGEGDFLVISLAAANADPEVHAGADVRDNVGVNRAHMAFACGEHSCPLGGPDLAEAIAKTAVEVLLDRLPDVCLAVPAERLRWNESTWLRSLESLPVTFTPVALTLR